MPRNGWMRFPRAPRWMVFALGLVLAATGIGRAENYAFLVGVGGYDEKQLRGLGEYPRRDVVEFRDVLLESGFRKENVVLMVDDLASLPETVPAGRYLPEAVKIRSELALLLPALERDDTLIVAFAGHGVQFKGEAEPYFCPADAKLTDKSTLLSLSWLYDQLRYDSETDRGCKPRRKLLLVDACRNDPASRTLRAAGGPQLESVSTPQLAPLPEGIVALFSCAEGQRALQHDPLKHGVFFYHVLEGWKGEADGDRDEQISLDEMIAYTKSRTNQYARLQLRALQTPRQKGFFEGNWILRAEVAARSLTNTLGMELRRIPAGEFLMGSPAAERGEADEHPRHRVRIVRPFYIGAHEVTRGQFAAFVKETGYRTEAETDREGGNGWNESTGMFEELDRRYSWRFTGYTYGDEHPVVNVSWNDAVKFCEWLSRKEGRTYRLPTEAEWEYACRSGSDTPYHFGDDPRQLVEYANVADTTARSKWTNYRDELAYLDASDGVAFTAPVGRYRANRFGLHDVHGNVWEWCADWYGEDYYESSPAEDPRGPRTGTYKIARGGGGGSDATLTRAAERDGDVPAYRAEDLGFRVVTDPDR